MRKEHKVKITRKDLYSKNYSKITCLNTGGGEGRISYANKCIVDILLKMIVDSN